MISVLQDPRDGEWQVWTDTEIGEQDGRIVGLGKTRREALKDATEELWADLGVCLGQLIAESQPEGAA